MTDGQVAEALRAAVAEIRGFRQAVTRLADQAAQFVPRDEFNEALSERTFRRHQLILTVIAMTLVFLAGAYGFYQIAQEVREGTRCMVEQMVEHRVAQRVLDRQEAEGEGRKLDESTLPPLPKYDLARLDACDDYENEQNGLPRRPPHP